MEYRDILASHMHKAGAPTDLDIEARRWADGLPGREAAVRATLTASAEPRWMTLEEVAHTLRARLASPAQAAPVAGVDGPPAGPGPMLRQLGAASCAWPCGPLEQAARVRIGDRIQAIGTQQRRAITEEEATAAIRALSRARVSDGHPAHRLVGPARYQVEEAQREAWAVARSKGRAGLSREQEAEFAAYLADADRRDREAGWVP
jgi:hypothetical protein